MTLFEGWLGTPTGESSVTFLNDRSRRLLGVGRNPSGFGVFSESSFFSVIGFEKHFFVFEKSDSEILDPPVEWQIPVKSVDCDPG